MLQKRPFIAFLAALFFLGAGGASFSDNPAFDTALSYGEKSELTVNNFGEVKLDVLGIEYFYNGKTSTYDKPFSIAPGGKKTIALDTPAPQAPGSYNVSTKVKYKLAGKPASRVDDSFVTIGQPAVFDVWVDVSATPIVESGTITVTFHDPALMEICAPVFPDELVITGRETKGNSVIFSVINARPDITQDPNIYWIFERDEETQTEEGALRLHRGGWLRIGMTIGPNSQPLQTEIGRIAPSQQYIDRNFLQYNYLSADVVIALTIVSLILFVAAVIVYRGKESLIPLMYVSAAFFLLNILMLLFQIPFYFNPSIPMPMFQLSPFQVSINPIAVFNTYGDYEYFRSFVLPVYYAFIMVYLVYSYLDLRKRKGGDLWNRLQEKKIWRVFAFLYARVRRLFKKPFDQRDAVWDPQRRTAFLAIMVKFFWMPMLWTWTINNVFVMMDQIVNMQPDFYRINEFVVNLIILADVAVFAFSYTVESRKTNSMIKSVEPTVLGWIVAIACYPPFNHFTFFWLDTSFVWVPNFELSEAVKIAAFSAVTLLWAIYVAATLALGFKASNLTNRGIVTRFPYNIVRHPAYAAKNLLWLVEFFLLSQKHVGLVVGFLVIYFWRAWTEERHLKKDPDYTAYMKKVKYRFIPGII